MKTWGDEAGFFWDQPIKVGRSALPGESAPRVKDPLRIPPPPSNYVLPTEFPPIKFARRISLDLETYDPHLKSKGPGTLRKDGFIVGIGVKTDDWQGDYYPVRHEAGPNLEPKKVFHWLQDNLGDYRGDIVGTNLLYEGDWLYNDNVRFPLARIMDVQWTEPLLDENAHSYKLDRLGSKWLGRGKANKILLELYGESYIENMHKVHPGHMKPYVMEDIGMPLEIIDKQMEQLRNEQLLDLWDLERRLYPVLLYMRRRGVRVDVAAAERLHNQLDQKRTEAQKTVRDIVGFDVDVWSSSSMAQAFDKIGATYPFTPPSEKNPEGNPSFRKEWLDAHPSDLAGHLLSIRKCDKFDGTFVSGILEQAVNGRIHALFHPVRSEDYGTVSGRFSSSNPNLQNIPTRDDFFGPLIRALFVPDEGRKWWSADYSQMEYRLLVHYALLARCAGADVVADAYRNDPKTDIHVLASELTGLPRKEAKNINFGIVYAMGGPTLAAKLGRTLADVKPILDTYHSRMPFCKQILKLASNRANDLGFVRTILARKRRFVHWEERRWRKADEEEPAALSHQEAIDKWGKDNIRRAFTHAALNAVLQGSNADFTKAAMVDVHEAGLIGEGAPLSCSLTVHDELDGDGDDSKPEVREAFTELKHRMANVIPLKVPVLVSGDWGINWSEAH